MKILRFDKFEKLKIRPVNVSDLICDRILYKPSSKSELKDAVIELLSKNGPNADLNCIDTSGIIDMFSLFEGLPYGMSKTFNANISRWDVSNVVNMCRMFANCQSFNGNLNKWNVNKVKDFRYMFHYCKKYNQPMDKWQINDEYAINMAGMFSGCENFNQNINTWNVSAVTNMHDMFKKCTKYNQPMDCWNVYNVKNLSRMFYECRHFNQNIGNWDVEDAWDIHGMFSGCVDFDKSTVDSWRNYDIKFEDLFI